jgi:hypothetical protein
MSFTTPRPGLTPGVRPAMPPPPPPQLPPRPPLQPPPPVQPPVQPPPLASAPNPQAGPPATATTPYQQLLAQYPGQDFSELKRWPAYYQNQYATLYLQGNLDAARAVIGQARTAYWQVNSAGLLYPNQDWFLKLDKVTQDYIVEMLNDPGALGSRLAQAQAAGNQQVVQFLTEIGALRTSANQYMTAPDVSTLPAPTIPTMYGGGVAPPVGTPPGGTTTPPADTGGLGTTTPVGTDQGRYSQAIDETARADPGSFVGYILGQMGWDQTGQNPLAASALRKATLTPYMRELQAGGYQNAPLYSYADWLENWTRNNAQPGAAGGGTGTAMSFGGGKQALQGLFQRANDPKNLEYDQVGGQGYQDAVSNLKTYGAAAFSDSLDPTYQRAFQSYADRQGQGYMDSVYGGQGAGDQTFVDWMLKNGFQF